LRLSRLLCALGLCCLLLQGCADTAEREAVYVVRPQDTLYSIAWRYGLDFRDLARWNNIGPDFRITVGQALILTPGSRAASTVQRPPAPSKAPVRSLPAPTAPTARRVVTRVRLSYVVAAVAGRLVFEPVFTQPPLTHRSEG